MSAGKGWHIVAPKKDDTRVVAQAIHSWVQSLGSPEDYALSQKPESDAVDRSEAAPDGTEARDETLATLLRAIQSTETARRLRGEALPGNGLPHASAPAEPPNPSAAAPTLEPLVDAPPPATSTLPDPPTAALPEQPLSDAAPESDETLATLLRAIESAELAAAPGGATSPTDPSQTDAVAPSEPPVDAPPPPASMQPDPPTAAPPEQSAPDRAAENNEIFAAWMRAMERTESAASLTGAAPPGDTQPDTPTPPEPANADAAAFILEPLVDALPPATSIQLDLSPVVAPEQSAPDRAAESDEIFAAWMRAMESAESAESLSGAASPGDGQPDAPTLADPTEPAEAIPTSTPPVQAAPLDAPKQPEAPKAAEPLPDIAGPADPAPPQPADTAEEAPAVTPTAEPKSVRSGLLRAPILVMLSIEIGRLCARFGLATDYLDRIELQLEEWFQRWFAPDPRQSPRVVEPPLVAYHWIVGTPQALKIANISSGGLHLLTDERWPYGNIISMTLQRTDIAKEAPDSWIAVDFVVIRWCQDGLAGAFIPSWAGLSYVDAGRAENCADKKMLEHFVRQLAPSARH